MTKNHINLYSAKQVAGLFFVKETTVTLWARAGVLPAIKVGRRWLFDEKDILEILDRDKKIQKVLEEHE